jgi:Flp pilus assembly protein TadG
MFSYKSFLHDSCKQNQEQNNIQPGKVAMRYRSKYFRSDDSGSVMLLTAISIVVLLGFAALAIDIGHLYVVKNELQNAADAGANAGARNLAPYITTNPVHPNWDSAQSMADSATKNNSTDKTLITHCQVDVGYYSLLQRGELKSTAIIPTSVDVPAVKVTVYRVDGQNNGPVLSILAQVLGINFTKVSAQAMAMISCPSTAPPGTLFPVTMNYSFVKNNFDTINSFNICSDYHTEEEFAGQFTTFYALQNDTDTVRELMDYGNPDPIRLGTMIKNVDPTYVDPGTKAALFNYIRQNYIGKVVFIPVVDYDIYTHSYNKVMCFVPIYIEDAKTGSQKYIRAHFTKDKFMQSNDAGGECYGAYMSPRIVN